MVIEKSWNMKNWRKEMEFCDQSWNFINFALRCCQICVFLADIEEFSIGLESLTFAKNVANKEF